MVDAFAAGTFITPVEKTFSINDIRAAHPAKKDNTADGKIVVKMLQRSGHLTKPGEWQQSPAFQTLAQIAMKHRSGAEIPNRRAREE